MEDDGKSHGVALVNSNAIGIYNENYKIKYNFYYRILIIRFVLDYEFIPNPGLIYRVTGGVLDFYMFLGPEPENVVQQFTQVKSFKSLKIFKLNIITVL